MQKENRTTGSRTRLAGLSVTLAGLLCVIALLAAPIDGALAGRLQETNAAEVWVAADGTCEGMPVGGICDTKIQDGVNHVDANGIVRVLPGTYSEFVVVDKPVTLRGPQSGIDPRATGTAPRPDGEAIVIPPNCSKQVNGNLFTVEADDVTITGFTMDGFNNALVGDPACDSSYTSGGVPLFVSGAVANGNYIEGFGKTYQPSNVRVRYNIIKNFNMYGVALGSWNNTGKGGHSILRNVFDNMLSGVEPNSWGARRAITMRGSQFGSIKENLITNAKVGIDLTDYFGSGAGTVFEVDDNDITSTRDGIWVGGLQTGTLPLTISNNKLRTLLSTPGNPATSDNTGMRFAVTWGNALVTVTDNTIYENARYGIRVFSVAHPNGITIKNTIITSPVIAGVYIHNMVPPDNYANGPMKVTLDNVDVTGGQTGILVDAAAPVEEGALLDVAITNGSSVIGAPATTAGLQIIGVDASVAVRASSLSGGGVGIQAKDGGVLSEVSNSVITGNTSHGIQLTDTAGEAGEINNNKLSDNGGLGVFNDTGVVVDASQNYWGAGDVSGKASGDVDYTPWLVEDIDTNTGAVGYQGSYAWLGVSDLAANVQPTWIGEGLGLVTTSGKVSVIGGTYDEDVALNRNVTLEFADGVTIAGGVSQSLGTLSAPAGTLTIEGDFVRSGGTFYHNSGTVALAGVEPQTLGGSAGTTFNNLLLGNAAGVTLGGNVTVNGTLTLNGLVFDLDAYRLTLGPNASVDGDPVSDDNLVAAVNGPFCKQFSADGEFTFPIGDNSDTVNYSPATLNMTGAGAAYSNGRVCVKVSDSEYVDVRGNDRLSRYWTVTMSGISGGIGGAFTFTYSTDDEDVGSEVEANMVALRFPAGATVPVTTDSTIDRDNNILTFNKVVNLNGVFTAGSPPPTLGDITVTVTRLNATSNRINWVVTNPGNLRYQVRRGVSPTASPVAVSPWLTGSGTQFTWTDQRLPAFTTFYYWLSVSDQSSGNVYTFGPYLLEWLRLGLPVLMRP